MMRFWDCKSYDEDIKFCVTSAQLFSAKICVKLRYGYKSVCFPEVDSDNNYSQI